MAAHSRTLRAILWNFVLWLVFFLIAAGLGYSTLNRYDPRKQLPDAAAYAQLANSGPEAIQNHFRFRVLTPLLARAVNRFAHGHTGTWDPLTFSFLVVNAMFVAMTAYVTFKIGSAQLPSTSVALFGAALYLLNFAIANLQLAGLVDAAEACFLMAMVASMFRERWALLPVWGVFGALAKESFVPFSVVMAIAWWIASGKRKRRGALWIASMVAAELITIMVLQSAISGKAIWPWDFARALNSQTGFLTNVAHSFVDRNSWYILAWLLPLGLADIRRFPRPWVVAVAFGTITALVLNAYHSTVGGGGGGIGRYIFDVAGPLLSLSAAAFLSERLRENTWQGELD
ncbi:MAG TPA: hypothetical protein VFA85_01065 [Terriglobales bacterium]|nr:hypothetical protein [Terriglobales bacterium]